MFWFEKVRHDAALEKGGPDVVGMAAAEVLMQGDESDLSLVHGGVAMGFQRPEGLWALALNGTIRRNCTTDSSRDM